MRDAFGRFKIGNKSPKHWKGKKLAEEHKKNISEGLKLAYKEKRKDGFKKGNEPWNKGKRGLQTPWNKGKKLHYNVWNYNPLKVRNYPVMFWKLRHFIRKRDNFQCQICEKNQKENGRKLDVHHIDYNKNNCNTSNLISLCIGCHKSVQVKKQKWIFFFNKLIKNKEKGKSHYPNLKYITITPIYCF